MRNNLRILLAERKMSVKELHVLSNISISTLTSIYYERANNPGIKTIISIANGLKVGVDELISYDDKESEG